MGLRDIGAGADCIPAICCNAERGLRAGKPAGGRRAENDICCHLAGNGGESSMCIGKESNQALDSEMGQKNPSVFNSRRPEPWSSRRQRLFACRGVEGTEKQ